MPEHPDGPAHSREGHQLRTGLPLVARRAAVTLSGRNPATLARRSTGTCRWAKRARGGAQWNILGSDDHAVSLVIQRLRRGGRTLEGRQTVIAHVREGKFSEVWFQPDDQAAFDEFFAHSPESAASIER